MQEAEPTFTVEYIGKGKWSVAKTCTINPTWDGAWIFYERTAKFDWNDDYYQQVQTPAQ